MKELSIEEKARAYDKAIKKIKYVMEHGVQPVLTKEDLQSIFPEIFESEDERIRKAIITFFESEDDNTTYALVPKKDILAWLEKQGNIDLEFLENGENEKREFVGYGFLKCKGDFLSFKEGETYWLEYVGKDNYNVRSDNLLGQTFHITPQQLYTVFRPTTWLEKQGQVNETIIPQHEDKTCKEKVDNANKVEPKFRVGDFVCNKNGKIAHIEDIKVDSYGTLRYYVRWSNGNKSDPMPCFFDENHLWTIHDAKDGDVLASGHLVFIFKVIHGVWLNCHCSAHNDGSFIADSYDLMTNKYFSEVHPATKEQRDLLFAKMREEGYTFDFDKKELKKIEQNLASSAKISKDDTLLDLLNKMPSYITVDGLDYHFVLKKIGVYIAYYECEGEEGRDKIIFWMAGDPVDLLTAMLEILKEKGLLK